MSSIQVNVFWIMKLGLRRGGVGPGVACVGFPQVVGVTDHHTVDQLHPDVFFPRKKDSQVDSLTSCLSSMYKYITIIIK